MKIMETQKYELNHARHRVLADSDKNTEKPSAA